MGICFCEHWAQHDPPKVTEALGQLPLSELRRGVARHVHTIWEQELNAIPVP